MIEVYKGTDTEDVFNVTQNGADYDLDGNGVTVVEAYVCNNTAQLVDVVERKISSPDDISWSTNVLTMKLGRLGVPPGNYQLKVVFITAAQPAGFVIEQVAIRVVCP